MNLSNLKLHLINNQPVKRSFLYVEEKIEFVIEVAIAIENEFKPVALIQRP